MTSLITGTWTLISSSAEIITGARRMTLRIHRLLQPGLLELSEGDRRRLLALQKRVNCLVEPLNFLLLWSKHRDSCVQQVVLSAQDLLSDVCGFVDRYFAQDGPAAVGSTKPAGSGSGAIDSEQLEYYLRELEFACASVSMAMSIANVAEATPTLAARFGGGPALPAGASDGSPCGGLCGGISLSALLRASRRIQEMREVSGDLCTCSGRLYTQAVGSSLAQLTLQDAVGGEGNVIAEERSQGGWSPVLSLAAFKVVRTNTLRYGISVESRLPLNQRERSPTPPPTEAGSRSREPSPQEGGGLNTSGPHNFPIEIALDSVLVTTGSLQLPAESSTGSLDFGVDALALVWGGGVPAGAAAQPLLDPASALGESGADLSDAVMVSEGHSSQDAPRSAWPAAGQRRRGASPPALSRAMNPISRYAFVFDCWREPRAEGDQEVALTPLDALYLARLCAHDDGYFQAAARGVGAAGAAFNEAAGGCPPHLLSSDEMLGALLIQRDPSPLSPAGGSSGAAGAGNAPRQC